MPDSRLDGPVPVLDVELRGEAVVLVLANIGADIAFRPRVAFSRAMRGLGGTVDVGLLPVWTTLTQLLPGRRHEVLLDTLARVLAADEEECCFTARVTYADWTGAEASLTYEHDLTAYRGLPRPLT